MARSRMKVDNVTAEQSRKTDFATLGDLIENFYHVHCQVGFVALSKVHIVHGDVVQDFEFGRKR